MGDNGYGNPRDQECGVYLEAVPSAGSATITCAKSPIGQFVSVVLNDENYLSLCEVEVKATDARCPGKIFTCPFDYYIIHLLTYFVQ